MQYFENSLYFESCHFIIIEHIFYYYIIYVSNYITQRNFIVMCNNTLFTKHKAHRNYLIIVIFKNIEFMRVSPGLFHFYAREGSKSCLNLLFVIDCSL